MRRTRTAAFTLILGATLWAQALNAAEPASGKACKGLPSYKVLKEALAAARTEGGGGFNFDVWATMVNRDGIVCAVVFTGADRGAQWPAGRLVSAEKANTANAFSNPGLSVATANLYSAVQPGGSLFGLENSNPVDASVAYRGEPAAYGQSNDPMVGGRIGGISVIGGGLALYNSFHQLIGGLGVSGDSACADHNIAWRTRHNLELDYVSMGVSGDPTHPDTIVYDITTPTGLRIGTSASGWGHPQCSSDATTVSAGLPAVPLPPPPKK